MGRGKGAVKSHNKDRKKKHKEQQRKKKRVGQEKTSGASTHSSVSSVVPPEPAASVMSVDLVVEGSSLRITVLTFVNAVLQNTQRCVGGWEVD